MEYIPIAEVKFIFKSGHTETTVVCNFRGDSGEYYWDSHPAHPFIYIADPSSIDAIVVLDTFDE